MANHPNRSSKGKIKKILDVLNTLPINGYPPLTRRNGSPSPGWVHGYYAISVAIKQTNLPWDYYWSGSNPTPSTQYPLAIVNAVLDAGIEL